MAYIQLRVQLSNSVQTLTPISPETVQVTRVLNGRHALSNIYMHWMVFLWSNEMAGEVMGRDEEADTKSQHNRTRAQLEAIYGQRNNYRQTTQKDLLYDFTIDDYPINHPHRQVRNWMTVQTRTIKWTLHPTTGTYSPACLPTYLPTHLAREYPTILASSLSTIYSTYPPTKQVLY